MSILHHLFWISEKTVTTLYYENGTFQLLRPEGKTIVPLTESFLDKWKEYAGMCNCDKADICLISDHNLRPNETLTKIMCEPGESIWSTKKIADAVAKLDVRKPTRIVNQNGVVLVEAGSFLNVSEKEIVRMTAWFLNEGQYKPERSLIPANTSAMIKYYIEELEKYNNGVGQ